MELVYKNIAIVGAGASGCMCAYLLLKKGLDVTLFDTGSALRTLLPTGGGRCNIAHAEFDFKELAKNYPRGEKFLYSVFSKFGTAETLSTFEEMGVDTYVQEDGRVFPNSNSAKEVREIVLKNIKKANFIKERVVQITPKESSFKLVTNNAQYLFDKVIIAIGGHTGLELLKNLDINLIEQKPSLVGLSTLEKFNDLSGTVLKGVSYNGLVDDVLYTHFGVSGPLIYTISSIKAFDEIPYKLILDIYPELSDLQKDLNNYPHKEIKNILNKYLPQKVVSFILKNIVDETTKAHQINGKTRDSILEKIHNFEINVTGSNKGEETVTAGGIDLNEINPKTMEIKKIPNLYAIGEILNIDGFCGGFNLQNAWSTAYVCASALAE